MTASDSVHDSVRDSVRPLTAAELERAIRVQRLRARLATSEYAQGYQDALDEARAGSLGTADMAAHSCPQCKRSATRRLRAAALRGGAVMTAAEDKTSRIAALLAADPEAFDWITAEGYRRGADEARAGSLDAATLRDTLLNIGADHEGCSLLVQRIDAHPEVGPGHWLLICQHHDESDPLLDFEELERAALREAQP